jgi:2-dehydro-3-deoxyphosphooctonate aldolase (KDO 8-P synthase)
MLSDLPYITHTGTGNFFLIAGPCVVESEDLCMEVSGIVKEITDRLKVPFIFKASYRKANRSRHDSFTGLGDTQALAILSKVRESQHVPVTTDIHAANEALFTSGYVDIIQIPAFLSRQTDILAAAAKTGKYVNIKKGQFMSPGSMRFAVEKVVQSGNSNILLTERGTMFGYRDLVVDFRGIPEMKQLGYPVVLDVTHSLQQPNQPEGISGGRPEMIETIARAGIAAGVDGIFLETHPDPSSALSDGANMLDIAKLEKLLANLLEIKHAVNRIK